MTDHRPMTDRRWPTTIACEGTPDRPHEQVTWCGTWLARAQGEGKSPFYDNSTCEPVCFVCGAPGRSTPPRFPLGMGNAFAAAARARASMAAPPVLGAHASDRNMSDMLVRKAHHVR